MTTTDRPRTGVRLAVLAISQFLVAVDFDIVFVALPQIGRALGFSPSGLQWVVSAFTVVLGGFLLLGGRSADRLGMRRMFVAGMALFGAASLAGGLATTAAALVVARGVQGLGAALIVPASLALIGATFAEGPERNRAFAVWGVAGASGAAVGAIGGGVLTAAFGWQAVLLVAVPVAAVLIVAARAFPVDGPRRPGAFDLPGAVLATAGATTLVYGIVTRSWAIAAGLALLAVFLLVEARTADPLLPPALLRRRGIALPAAAVFLFMGSVAAAYYLITVFLQDALGFGPLLAGLAFLPMSVLSMAGSGLVFPRLVARYGVQPTLAIGLGGMAVGLAGLALAIPFGSYLAVAPWLAWTVFAGVAFPAVYRAAGAAARAEEQGVAAAFVSTAQYVGGAIGLAAILAATGLDHAVGDALPDALRDTGLVAAAVVLVGAVLVAALRPTGSPRT